MRPRYLVLIIALTLITAAQFQQTAEEWFYKGVEFQEQGKYDEAIRCYNESIRLKPYAAHPVSNSCA